MRSILFNLLLLMALGCASAGSDGPSRSADDPSGSGTIGATGGNRLLEFRLTVNPNGQIDTTGRGYYLIFLNANGQPIEVTDLDTFTDFIRFDGRNFDFFHRQLNQPNAGFNFVQVGSLAGSAQISPDGRSIDVVLDVGESTSFLNQFIVANTFTAHAGTTDNFQGAFVGRLIDTLGQGPNIGSNSLQTITVRKGSGAIDPRPQSYPIDAQADHIIQNDLAADFPYQNFDIVRFEVTAR